MKIKDAVCIYVTNAKQVKWWNNVASKLVKWELLDKVAVDEGHETVVGYVFAVSGLLAKWVVKKNLKFIPNPEVVVFRANKEGV